MAVSLRRDEESQLNAGVNNGFSGLLMFGLCFHTRQEGEESY